MSWNGEDLFKAVLLGSGGSSGGGSSGGGIPQADIDAAFAALAEKGVTVPDGATSADLDDLIASIVTGGGASNIARGEVTLGKDYSNITDNNAPPNATATGLFINHGIDKPKGLLFCAIDVPTDGGAYACLARYVTEDVGIAYSGNGSAHNVVELTYSTEPGTLFTNTFRYAPYAFLNRTSSGFTSGIMSAGTTLLWFVWK